MQEWLEKEKRICIAKLGTLEICALCSKPHQFLAFGFLKWLKWNRKEIAQKHSLTKFKELSEALIEETRNAIKDMNSALGVDPGKSFWPLEKKLEEVTSIIYPKNESPLLYAQYGSVATKRLAFNLLYEKDPSKGPKEDWERWNAAQKKKYPQTRIEQVRVCESHQ